MMQFAARHEGQKPSLPKNVVNRHVPGRLLRDATQDDRAQWRDGKVKIVELKCINMGPSRYDSREATSPRAAVNKREQQLYRAYLTKLRLKDRNPLHTPDDRPLGARIHKPRPSQSRGHPLGRGRRDGYSKIFSGSTTSNRMGWPNCR